MRKNLSTSNLKATNVHSFVIPWLIYAANHWTDQRIKGHICLCYIAYTLLNHLQLSLKEANKPHSENQIRKSLDRMQLSLVQQGVKLFYLRANLDQHQSDLLQILTLKKLPTILPKENLAGYL